MITRRLRSSRGFSVLELLMVVAIVAILASVAIGVTPSIIQTAKGQSSAHQLSSFLKRTREMAISRRRNIEVRFLAPDRVQTAERAVAVPPNPPPAPTVLETLALEGRLQFRTFPVMPDTPDAFGNGQPINLGGANPVMFTSEGTFSDANGDPINASIFVGVESQPNTANAITILGTTAAVRNWRWDGGKWIP